MVSHSDVTNSHGNNVTTNISHRDCYLVMWMRSYRDGFFVASHQVSSRTTTDWTFQMRAVAANHESDSLLYIMATKMQESDANCEKMS